MLQGLGVLCVNMYDLLLPAIQLSTDVNQASHVYLIEDGLELWHMTLHQSPCMTPPLLALYDNMPQLLRMYSVFYLTYSLENKRSTPYHMAASVALPKCLMFIVFQGLYLYTSNPIYRP